MHVSRPCFAFHHNADSGSAIADALCRQKVPGAASSIPLGNVRSSTRLLTRDYDAVTGMDASDPDQCTSGLARSDIVAPGAM